MTGAGRFRAEINRCSSARNAMEMTKLFFEETIQTDSDRKEEKA